MKKLNIFFATIFTLFTLQSKAQNEVYWRESFSPTGPTADPGATSTVVDYFGEAGTWKFYGVYLTTGTACENGVVAGTGIQRHIRSTNNTGIVDTAYIVTPLVGFGINELHFLRSRTNRRYTIWKTTDTSALTTNWSLAAVIGKGAAFPSPLCQDSTIIINDANAKRLMIKFEKAGNSDIDSVFITSVAQILPVNFTHVSAAKSIIGIDVSWSVGTEVNTEKYMIEKSLDGRNFMPIGTVEPKSKTIYTFTDASVFDGGNFYRIKAVDKSGAFQYSAVASVNGGGLKADIKVFPNPVTNGDINVFFNNLNKGTYNVVVYNSLGQNVYVKSMGYNGSTSKMLIVLPLSIKTGTYRLLVTDGVTKVTKTISVR